VGCETRSATLDRVETHDNCFDLGGHSLAATRIVSHVLRHFQLEIPLRSLFKSPTVAEMARVIIQSQANKLEPEDPHRILAELEAHSDAETK
jgi:acyl carrier protein